MASEQALERAREVLRRAPVVDGHNDVLWEARDRAGYDFDRFRANSTTAPATNHGGTADNEDGSYKRF